MTADDRFVNLKQIKHVDTENMQMATFRAQKHVEKGKCKRLDNLFSRELLSSSFGNLFLSPPPFFCLH